MSDGVMIAFLPTNSEWCRLALPHMTLVYAGTIGDLAATTFNELGKDAISVARLMRGPFELTVTGTEVMGDDEKVDVLNLYPTPELILARRLVEDWNASEFKDFKPHATVGPVGSARGMMPQTLFFDRVYVGWGNENLTFPLDRWASPSRLSRDRDY